MRRWWQGLSWGERISVFSLIVAVLAALPAWLALRPDQGGSPTVSTAPAPGSTVGPVSSSTGIPPTSATATTSAQAPIRKYAMTARYPVAINLDNGKQVSWNNAGLPNGADLYTGNFYRVGARDGSQLYKILDTDTISACRAAMENSTEGSRDLLVEGLAKGDVICTDTDQGRIALITITAPPRRLYGWIGGLVLDIQLWPS
jgi:hypothetical protein